MKNEFKKISKEEFCRNTKTDNDCWIFKRAINPEYWHNPEENWYYFNNGIDTLYRFKDMPEYGEIWLSKFNTQNLVNPQWSIWSPWTQYG